MLERVERNIYDNLGVNAVFDYGEVAPWNEGHGIASKVKHIRRKAFLEATGMVDFKLRRFAPAAAIRKANDTWRYALYRDEHPGAPTRNGKPLRLGFSEDSAGVIIQPRMDAEYSAVLKNLSGLDSLAKSFGARLLFVMPPNRELMWERGVRYPQYDRLYGMLDSAGIENVNLVVPFQNAMSAGKEVYWKTDSLWNGNAHRIASELIANKLREMLSIGRVTVRSM